MINRKQASIFFHFFIIFLKLWKTAVKHNAIHVDGVIQTNVERTAGDVIFWIGVIHPGLGQGLQVSTMSISYVQGTSELWIWASNTRFLEGPLTQPPIRISCVALCQWPVCLLVCLQGQEHSLPGAWLFPSEKSFAPMQKLCQGTVTHSPLTTGLAETVLSSGGFRLWKEGQHSIVL